MGLDYDRFIKDNIISLTLKWQNVYGFVLSPATI